MARNERFMQQQPTGKWVVRCRICGRRANKVCDTAAEAHDWWRTHTENEYHQSITDTKPRQRRRMSSEFKILQGIFS